jgi:hypothetical protein
MIFLTAFRNLESSILAAPRFTGRFREFGNYYLAKRYKHSVREILKTELLVIKQALVKQAPELVPEVVILKI